MRSGGVDPITRDTDKPVLIGQRMAMSTKRSIWRFNVAAIAFGASCTGGKSGQRRAAEMRAAICKKAGRVDC